MSGETAKDLGPEIEQGLGELKAKLQRARDLDWQEMQDHHGFWDQVGSAIKNAVTNPTFFIPVVGPTGSIVMGAFKANEAKGAAEDALKQYEQQMWGAHDAMRTVWDRDLKGATAATLRLAVLARTWEAQQKSAFTTTAEQIRGLEQQEHWTGESAEAYRKAIPSQRGAVTQFGDLVGGSSNLFDQAGMAMGSTFATVDQANSSARGAIAEQEPVNSPENWGRRMRAATQIVAGASGKGDDSSSLLYGLNAAVKFLQQLGEMAMNGQRSLTDQAHHTPPFAKSNGKWPEAKGDTTAMAAGA